MTDPTLVFIFNHRFDKNIPKLESYYSDRFSRRFYLVPFAARETDNVIKVYANGTAFSGHISQAYPVFRRTDSTHYVFVADDLILNPVLDDKNLIRRLQLSPEEGYIKSITPLQDVYYHWCNGPLGTRDVRKCAFNYESELPSVKEAMDKFENLGVPVRKLWPRTIRDWIGASRKLRVAPLLLLEAAKCTGRLPPYPLLAGYADFVVVPSGALDRFVHFCGVFGAMNLFAEIAIPTALALACDKIQTELVPGEFFADSNARRKPNVLQGVELWSGAVGAFEQKLQRNFSALLADFPVDKLYVHPIKLSRWH